MKVNKLYSVAEVATLLQRDPSVVKRLCASGVIKAFKLDGSRAWLITDFSAAKKRKNGRPKKIIAP